LNDKSFPRSTSPEVECISYQVWEEGYQAKLIQNEEIHWRYSSARDYEDIKGLIEVERFW
jgi:hypothetical protein